MKFLDYTGLKLVVEQIKLLLVKKADTSYVDDEISKVETNLDGGKPTSVYGGMETISGGGVINGS